MLHTGQKPGPGPYECTACEEIMLLTDYDDMLPPCPYCKAEVYAPVETLPADERRFYSGYF
jgi:hypothetical protein